MGESDARSSPTSYALAVSVDRAWPCLENMGFSLGPGLAPILNLSCSPTLQAREDY